MISTSSPLKLELYNNLSLLHTFKNVYFYRKNVEYTLDSGPCEEVIRSTMMCFFYPLFLYI